MWIIYSTGILIYKLCLFQKEGKQPQVGISKSCDCIWPKQTPVFNQSYKALDFYYCHSVLIIYRACVENASELKKDPVKMFNRMS